MSVDIRLTESDLESLRKQFPGLSSEIIQSVAQECNFDAQRTMFYLYEMTKGIQSKQLKVVDTDEVRIIRMIREGWKVVVLMRGLPGSGKTVLANQIFNSCDIGLTGSKFILSTDEFFNKNGRYVYDVKELEKAHTWNQKRSFKAMVKGFSPIIIDNTNLMKWEMQPYCEMAVEFGYVIEILEPSTKWARDPRVLAQKNTHNVPKDKIVHMLNRFEMGVTSSSLLREFQLRYTQHIPQKRLFPPLIVRNDVASMGTTGFSSASTIVRSDSFDFSFEQKDNKKEMPIMEYVHSFDDKCIKDAKKTDDVKEGNITDNKEPKQVNIESSEPKSVANDTKACEPIQISSSEPKVAANEPKKASLYPKLESIEPKIMPSEPKVVPSEPKVVPSESKLAPNEPKLVSDEPKIMPNEPKLVSCEPKMVSSEPNEPKAPTNDPNVSSNASTMDLIDLLDDATVTTPSNLTNLVHYGAYPLMPVQAPTKSDSDSDIQSKKMKSNDPNPKSPEPLNSNAHLTAWGTNEKALQSWETVVPLKISQSDISMDFEILKRIEEASNRLKIQMSDKTTNTQSEDFKFAQNCPEANGTSILKAQSRPINTGGVVIKNYLPRRKITVDMGCMTEEAAYEKIEDHAKQLMDVFPNIPLRYMLDVYEKCDKDLNWTLDLLSETDYVPNLSANQTAKETASTDQASAINSWELLEVKESDRLENEREKLLRQQEILDLKRQLEENVNFGKEHYSEHIWGLKNQRHGVAAAVQENSFDAEAQNGDEESDSTDEESDDALQISLGDELVGQLEKIFGNEDFVNKKFHTIVQLPVSLAKQIHALYLQSVCHQIEEQNELIIKDEEYAQKIDNEQREALKEPNLNAIMDEQLAQFYQKKDMELYKTMAPDTLAMILKKKKLHEAFPSVAPAIIDNLLQSQNYNYELCADTLIASVNQSFIVPVRNLRESPITDDVVKDMKANKAIVEQGNGDDEVRTVEEFRDKAMFYSQTVQRLRNLAQTYHKKGWGEVAVFYSKLAEDMKSKSDVANQKATYMQLQQNTIKLRDGDTLDLHFLTVKEALTSLDVFVDTRISNLSKKRQEDYFVITGRGKRSPSGKSKLKPAVIARLKKRNIRYFEINPGLLKIKVHKDLTMSTDLKK